MLKTICQKGFWLWAILFSGLASLYFYFMKPDVAGFLYDDGMYLMTAKALATGQGYRLPDIVGSPWFYKYPPLFPVVLALGWLITPEFPGNIVWLKSFNILLSLITLGLWGYYFKTIRQFSLWLSLGLVALIGTNWRFIEVSIELMSEPLFMMLSSLTLVLCHRFSQPGEPLKAKHLLILILLSVATFYTRSMALPLIGAMTLWLFIQQSRKQAFQYGITCFFLMIPWFAWSASKPDKTYTIGDFLVRSFQETYFQSFRMDLKYEYNLFELVSKGLSELLGNLSVQFFPLLERFFLSKPTLLSESLILGLSFAVVIILGRYAYQQIKARQFSAEGLYVGLYLSILPFWSFYKFYPRFIMPLLPILWAAFFLSVAKNSRLKTVTPILLALLLGLNAIHLWPYLHKSSPNDLVVNSSVPLWEDHQAAFRFLKTQTPPHSHYYLESTDENYFYALNTAGTIFDFFLFLPGSKLFARCPDSNPACLNQLFQQRTQSILGILADKQPAYLIISHVKLIKNQYNNGYQAVNIMPLWLQQSSQNLKPVFQTPDHVITIYQWIPAEKRSVILPIKTPA